MLNIYAGKTAAKIITEQGFKVNLSNTFLGVWWAKMVYLVWLRQVYIW